MRYRLPVLLVALLAAIPAQAILTRADRDDEEYLELARRYTSSVLLNAPAGEGVLIAPRWVLTSAYMAQALKELKTMPKLEFAGRPYEIQSVHIHPDWKEGGQGGIALLVLSKPVIGVKPTALYRGTDEGGKAVVIAGHGPTGKIGQKPLPKDRWDKKRRAAINTVDRVSPRTLGLRIKAGDDASDLQGAAGPGDGGAPAYIETADGLFVAGIGYAPDDNNAEGIVGTVGDWEIYARVSAFVPWIEAQMLELAARDAADLMGDSERR